jgi:anti-sigma factor RsiW
MRLAGLSICLLVSTLTARAEALEERVATLEQTIRSLESALSRQAAVTVQPESPAGAGARERTSAPKE